MGKPQFIAGGSEHRKTWDLLLASEVGAVMWD